MGSGKMYHIALRVKVYNKDCFMYKNSYEIVIYKNPTSDLFPNMGPDLCYASFLLFLTDV